MVLRRQARPCRRRAAAKRKRDDAVAVATAEGGVNGREFIETAQQQTASEGAQTASSTEIAEENDEKRGESYVKSLKA
jgi:hypothetical protein